MASLIVIVQTNLKTDILQHECMRGFHLSEEEKTKEFISLQYSESAKT